MERFKIEEGQGKKIVKLDEANSFIDVVIAGQVLMRIKKDKIEISGEEYFDRLNVRRIIE